MIFFCFVFVCVLPSLRQNSSCGIVTHLSRISRFAVKIRWGDRTFLFQCATLLLYCRHKCLPKVRGGGARVAIIKPFHGSHGWDFIQWEQTPNTGKDCSEIVCSQLDTQKKRYYPWPHLVENLIWTPMNQPWCWEKGFHITDSFI